MIFEVLFYTQSSNTIGIILQAQDDRGFKPGEQAALRATYPGAQVHLFDSGGHWAMFTRREEYEAVLNTFLGVSP